MESRVKILGHPVHQMIVPLPFGLLLMSVIFDAIGLWMHEMSWSRIAYSMLGAGIVTGFLAAPFGLIDWLAIPSRTRAKRVGAAHGIGNLIMLVFFAMSWAMRAYPPQPPAYALVLSFMAGGIAVFTGWLGGELVDRLGIGVDPGANPDAPSSLSSRRPIGG